MPPTGTSTYEELFATAVREAERKGVPIADPTPPVNRRYTVNGLDLHLLDWEGDARPPMLLLHGALTHAHVWDFFSLEMRQYFHVHSVDQRGHGDSAWAPEGDYRRTSMADDVVALFEHLDLTSTVLIGHSMGGSVAAVVAARQPERVRALVLVDSTLLPSGQPSIRTQIATGPTTFASFDDFVQHAATLNRRRDPARLANSLLWNARELADGRWTWKYDPVLLQPGRGTGDFEQVWTALAAFKGPVLFVRAGEHSHVSEAAETRLRALGHVRMVTVADAAHNVMGDNPLGFGRVVAEFLSAIDHTDSRPT